MGGLPALDDSVVVLDGGLASTLEERGHDLSGGLWSARLLRDAPDEILAVHRAFFQSGAVIATSATYQASFSGFAAYGIERAEAARLMRRGVRLAAAARAEFPPDRPRWVAASVGPFGASLADGSEYRGRYGLSIAALAAWHRPRLEVLADAEPDFFALETIPDVDEGAALVEAVAQLGVPAWLSYSIDGPRTRAGQPLAEAFAVAAGAREIVAVGVNCCRPEDVREAVVIAAEVTGKPVVVYPNSGEGWDNARRRWVGPDRYRPELARDWVASGARIVGGCCRVSPRRIAEIAEVVAPAAS